MTVVQVIVELDRLAAHASEVSGEQASAGLANDTAVTYWTGQSVAYRRAAALLREASGRVKR